MTKEAIKNPTKPKKALHQDRAKEPSLRNRFKFRETCLTQTLIYQ